MKLFIGILTTGLLLVTTIFAQKENQVSLVVLDQIQERSNQHRIPDFQKNLIQEFQKIIMMQMKKFS